MFNNNDNGSDASAQDSGQSPFDVFSDPFQLMEEDSGLIQPSVDFSFTPNDDPNTDNGQQSDDSSDSNQQQQQQQGSEEENEGGEATTGIQFDDELVNKFKETKTKDELSEEELIAKLKEKGYQIPEKASSEPQNSEEALENQEFERLNQEFQNAQSFLNKSDDEIIREKSRDDLIKKYQQLGKAHLIATQEFETDLDIAVDDISQSDFQKKNFADNIRNGIQRYIDKIENDKKGIIQNRQERNDRKIAANRMELQGSLNNIISKGKFLGVDINAEQAQTVYSKITSGEFAKTINSNPSLVAKLAFFTENLEAIESALGGASYGEGVKDAVNAIREKGTQVSKSPIRQAINSSNAQGGNNRLNSWRLPEIEDDKNGSQQPLVVAGNRV